jgi:uncharacterized protein (DUF1501 family)
MNRRFFIKNGVPVLAGLGVAPVMPAFLRQTVFAADPIRRGKVLVCLFQRGAADGLSMVPPHGDADYYKLRSEIALARPGKSAGNEAALELTDRFGLHPALAPLLPIFKSGELAIIHACGSPSANRSHFDSQDFMEAGVADNKSVASGWLNRLLLATEGAPEKHTPFRAVSMTVTVPRSLMGDHESLAIPDLGSFGVRSGVAGGVLAGRGMDPPARPAGAAAAAGGFESLYASAVDQVLRGTGQESFEAISMLKKADPMKYQAANGARYPGGSLGRALAQVAQLIKAGVGLEVACAESGGWDTHANQGAATGQLAGRLVEFGQAIAAFHRDMGDRMADVVVLTMSEFGRTVRQNGNRGTDHGHGTCFFALGGGIKGGKILGRWPGLAAENLFQGRDLEVTTDFRDVFAEIAQAHLGATNLSKVFPSFKVEPRNQPGLLRV